MKPLLYSFEHLKPDFAAKDENRTYQSNVFLVYPRVPYVPEVMGLSIFWQGPLQGKEMRDFFARQGIVPLRIYHGLMESVAMHLDQYLRHKRGLATMTTEKLVDEIDGLLVQEDCRGQGIELVIVRSSGDSTIWGRKC